VAATQTPDPERVPDTPDVAEYRAATKNLSPDTSNPRGARVFEAMKTLRPAVQAGDMDEARRLAPAALPVVQEAYEWATGSEWANPKAQKSAVALYGRPLKYLKKLIGGAPSAVSKAVNPVAAYTRRSKSGQIVQVGGYTRDRRPGRGGQQQAPAHAQGPRVTMKPAKHASTSAEDLQKRYGKATADHHAYIEDRPVMLRQHGAGGKRGYAVYDADGKLMATAHVQALPDGQGAALTATWTAPEAYGQQAHSPLLRRLVGEFGKVYSPHAVHADLWATVHRMGGDQGGEFEAADEGNRKRLQRKAQAGLFDSEDESMAKSVRQWVVVFGDLAKSLRLLKGRVKSHYKPSIGKWVPSYTTKRPEAMQQAGQMSMFGEEDEDEGETTPAPDAVDGVPTADSSLLVDSRGRFFGPPALKAFVDSKSQGQERMFSAKALAYHLQQGRLSSDFVRFLTAMGPEGVGALLQAVEQHGFYSGVNSWEEHVRHIRSRSNAENSAVRSMLGVFEALGAPSMSPTDAPRADEMRSKMMQLLPGTEASETVAPQAAAPEPPAEAAERSVVYLPGQTPAGPLMIFGLKVGDTVYPARDFAHMVGDKITGDAVGRWQSLTEEQRQLYLGKQHSPRSKSAVRARHIKDIERNGDALIATAEERSREQEEGKAEAARREGLVNTAGERGFGVRLDEIKPGMVLEHADGTRYRVTEVDEYGPIGRDLSRPRSEAPVTMGKLEHLRVVNVQPPTPDAPAAGAGEAQAKVKRSAGDPYPARRVGDEFAHDDDDGGWKPASLKQHFIAAHKAGRMDLWEKLAEARRGLRRQNELVEIDKERAINPKHQEQHWGRTADEYRARVDALQSAIKELGLKRPGPDPEAASVRAKNALDMAQREADRLERDKVPANSDAGRRASENLRKRRERHEHLQAAPKSLRAVASPRRFAVIFRTRGAA
jgi:hypothetical protein